MWKTKSAKICTRAASGRKVNCPRCAKTSRKGAGTAQEKYNGFAVDWKQDRTKTVCKIRHGRGGEGDPVVDQVTRFELLVAESEVGVSVDDGHGDD